MWELKHVTTIHLEKIQGTDGDYEIDVAARFEAPGGSGFLLDYLSR